MVWFSKGWAIPIAIAMVLTFENGPFEILAFLSGFERIFDKIGGHLSGFQMVGASGFQIPFKPRPFANQPLFYH